MSGDQLNVVGFDPSLRNWGVAVGTYHVGSGDVAIHQLAVIQPVIPTGKQVRQNSKDLEAAFQLAEGAQRFLPGAHAVFVEIPVGSQSARSMASYALCIGVLGALRAQGLVLYEVTATEVKLVATNNKQATKQDMIAWGHRLYPDANWPRYRSHGDSLISEAKAEHMADAIAAIHAGVTSIPFRQALAVSRPRAQGGTSPSPRNPHAYSTQAI